LFEAARGGRRPEEAVRYAATLYARALRALDAAGAGTPSQLADLLLALGEAQRRAGASTAARETFRRAGDVARSLGSADRLARAAIGLSLGTETIVPYAVDDRVVSALEESLRVLGSGEHAPVLRAAVTARLAAELHYGGSQERVASLAREAVAVPRRPGDEMARGFVLTYAHFALWSPCLDRGRANWLRARRTTTSASAVR
jgi:hypothetical protein